MATAVSAVALHPSSAKTAGNARLRQRGTAPCAPRSSSPSAAGGWGTARPVPCRWTLAVARAGPGQRSSMEYDSLAAQLPPAYILPDDPMTLATRDTFTNFKKSVGSGNDDDDDSDDEDEWEYDDDEDEDDGSEYFLRDEEAEAEGLAGTANRRVKGKEERESEMQIKRQLLENQNWVTGGRQRPTAYITVDESSEQYFDFLQYIGLAAQDGIVNEVEMLIQEMEVAGMPPGPRTYHGLVFAHLEAGDISGALDVFRQEYLSGIIPMAQTFHAIIKAILKTRRNPEHAVVLYNECTALHKVNIQPLWSTLVLSLLEQDCGEDAEYEFELGLQRRLKPTHKMYEGIINELCNRDTTEDTQKAMNWLEHMQNNGLFAMREHVRPIIAACCRGGRGTTALELFLSMGEDGVQEPSREESNIIITHAHNTLFKIESSSIRLVFDHIGCHDAWPDKELYAMGLEVTPNGARLAEYARCMPKQYPDLLACGLMQEDTATDILGCCRESQDTVDLLAHMIETMSQAGLGLPLSLMYPALNKGMSLLTSPLQSFQHTMSAELDERNRAEERPVDEMEEYTPPAPHEVEGFGIKALIGAGSCIVDDFGDIIAPSKLSVKMLRLELRERGLDTEGSRTELYNRVQEARQSSESIKMFREFQKEERIAERKKEKREKAETEKARKKGGDTWADLYLDVTRQHYKFNEVGEPVCYYVETKTVGEIFNEYYVTSQTKRALGLGRPGDTQLGGRKKKLDLNADADQIRPPSLSNEELQVKLWEHARDKEGMSPAAFRALLHPRVQPAPELLQITVANEDGTFTTSVPDGMEHLLGKQQEQQQEMEKEMEEAEAKKAMSLEQMQEGLRQSVLDSLLLFSTGESAGCPPTEEDLLEVTRVATASKYKDIFGDILAVIERNVYDERDVAEMFEMLIISALYDFFDADMAASLYDRMLAMDFPMKDHTVSLKEMIDDFDPVEARARMEEEAEIAAKAKFN